MTRKSKRAGGSLPLTHHERHKYVTAGLGGSAASAAAVASSTSNNALPLGVCALTLSKIDDPPLDAVVVTPSGHVYSKAALLEYLLHQTKEYQQQQVQYEATLQRQEQLKQKNEQTQQQHVIQQFEELQQQRGRNNDHHDDDHHQQQRASSVVVTNNNDDHDTYQQTRRKNIKQELQKSSFWLAEAQPSLQDAAANDANQQKKKTDMDMRGDYSTTAPPPPPPLPTRPVSPCSGQLLRRKQWRQVVLERHPESGHVLCGFSGKTILTQPAVAIFPPNKKKKSTNTNDNSAVGYVVLQQVYEEYIRPTMQCPKTDLPLQEARHVVVLQGGGGGIGRRQLLSNRTKKDGGGNDGGDDDDTTALVVKRTRGSYMI
jgi:nitric oxide synthase-interacting protein